MSDESKPARSLMGKFGLLVLLATVGVAGLLLRGDGGGLRLSEVDRRHPHPGIEYLSASVSDGTGPRGRLVALFVEPEKARLQIAAGKEPRLLSELAGDHFAALNAGYFTQAGRPTGLLVSQGKRLHRFVRQAGGAGSGVMVVDDEGVRLLRKEDVRPQSLNDAHLAIQAGPRLIEPDGSLGIHGDDGRRANRSVVGRDRSGRLALVVVHAADSGFALGPTLFELQSLLREGLGELDPELALDAALNLDGGPSSGLIVRKPDVVIPAGSRVVSAIVLDPS